MIYKRFSEDEIDAHELVRVRHFNTNTHEYDPIRFEGKYTRTYVEGYEPYYTIRHNSDYTADGSWFYMGYENGNEVYYEITLQDEWTAEQYNKTNIFPFYKFVMTDPIKRDTLLTFGLLIVFLCFGALVLFYYFSNWDILNDEYRIIESLEAYKGFFILCGIWGIVSVALPMTYRVLLLKGMTTQDKFNSIVKEHYEYARQKAITADCV